MAEIAAVKTEKPTARKVPVRASAAYPYFDLNDSLSVARAIYERRGGSCTPDQLAVELTYKSTSSGTYQTRVSAAKQFGFIKADNGVLAVTERAIKALAPVLDSDAKNVKVDAFLGIDLFRQVFDKFKGSTLPPRVGLKNLFLTSYGISEDRVEPAIRVFMSSAEQAGMFPNGEQTRLVIPTFAGGSGPSHTNTPPPDTAKPKSTTQGGSEQSGGDEPPGQRQRFEVPIPGKPSAVVSVPADLDADDWDMLNKMMSTYIERWKKFATQSREAPKPEAT